MPNVSPCPTMGTHKHLLVEPSARCEQLMPPARSLHCGWPRRKPQQDSGENSGAETLSSPQRTAASTRLRDDLNRYNVPERASGKSFCTDWATTAQASWVVPQHSS